QLPPSRHPGLDHSATAASPRIVHSIPFRVRRTVRREVPAVTAATSTTRPIIAPYPSGPSERFPNSTAIWLSPALPLNQSDMVPASANSAIAVPPPAAPP